MFKKLHCFLKCIYGTFLGVTYETIQNLEYSKERHGEKEEDGNCGKVKYNFLSWQNRELGNI